MKFCRQCEQWKHLADFPCDRCRPDGRWHTCKRCHVERQRLRRGEVRELKKQALLYSLPPQPAPRSRLHTLTKDYRHKTCGAVPKHDIAKEVALAIFQNNPEMIYKAFRKILRRGNAYAFQVLADRAFGKLKESYAIERSPYKGVSDEEIEARIAELKRKLGWPESEPPAAATKPN